MSDRHLPAFAVTLCATSVRHSVPQLTQRLPLLFRKEVLVSPSHLLGLAGHEVVNDAVVYTGPSQLAAWGVAGEVEAHLLYPVVLA